MKLYNFKIKIEVILLFFLISSFFVGFYFDENSSGGAFIDYKNQSIIINAFSVNFTETILNYDKYLTRHSPVLIIFLSFLKNLGFNDVLIRFSHSLLCLFLPYLFFICLRLQFPNTNNKIIISLTGLIFLSPYFRSLAIWPDSRILGLTLFMLSVYYFLLFQKEKDFKFAIFNTASLALSSYVSPNFAVFAIFFFFYFYSYFGVSKNILILIIFNIFLSIPAFYYLFILDVNFLTVKAFKFSDAGIGQFNLGNKILLICSIIFFHLFPFFLSKVDSINLSKNLIIKFAVTVVIFFICLYVFNYSNHLGGGGIFFKISNYLFNNNLLFYIISFFSLFLIVSRIFYNFNDLLIFIILVSSNIQYSIYHKYYDLLLLFVFLFLMKGNIKLDNLQNNRIIFIYLYFLMFLLINFFKSKFI